MFLYRAILLHETFLLEKVTFLLEKVTFLQLLYKPTGIDYQQINIYAQFTSILY